MVVVLNVKRVRPKRSVCARRARTEHPAAHVSDGLDGRMDGEILLSSLQLQVCLLCTEVGVVCSRLSSARVGVRVGE
jgi:hypothetical protein